MPRIKKSKASAGRVVFSTELGRVCSTCSRPVADCRCADNKREAAKPPTDGVVRVRREKKGRGGKTVTTVSGVPVDDKELGLLAKRLKKKCGVGGSIKDWVIVIQGDKVDVVVATLEGEGFKVKRAGG